MAIGMTDVELRPATPADADTIATLWHSGWRDGHLGNVPDALAEHRSPASFRDRTTAHLADTTVAVVGDEIAGFIMVGTDEAEQVYVAATHRGSGLATVLLSEAERQIAAAGFTTAWLAVVPGNTRARRFYERQGWHDAGGFTYEATTATGTFPVPCRRYEKPLP
jgi:ribosomal protein S18 acetylase RimI-like enzyme